MKLKPIGTDGPAVVLAPAEVFIGASSVFEETITVEPTIGSMAPTAELNVYKLAVVGIIPVDVRFDVVPGQIVEGVAFAVTLIGNEATVINAVAVFLHPLASVPVTT